MLILGLHFGHDAAAALVRDGVVIGCIEKERHTRRKHAAILRSAQVKALLDDCGVRPEEIDYCTVTSTQYLELTFFDPE
jgi:carbamoyltransferase